MVTIKRIIELDQIKGIAILGVVLLHSVFTQLGHQPYLHSLWNIQDSYLRYAADSLYFQMAYLVLPLFVLVLGINFVLQMNKMQIRVFGKESLKRFYANKLERIVFPVLVLGIIEYVGLALLSTFFSVSQLLVSYVTHPVLGLGALFIPFLLVFYFIAAPIVLWLYRKTGVWIILISLLLFPISYLIFTYAHLSVVLSAFYDYVFFIFYWAPLIALGCVMGGYLILNAGKFNARALLNERWFVLILIIGLALYIAAFVLSYSDVSNDWNTALPTSIAVIVPFTILFIVFKYFNDLNRKILSFLSLFGKLSLEIYLVQLIYFSSTRSQIILGANIKALLGVSSNTVVSVGVTFIITLAIITLLALIAAYCLPKLFSVVKRLSLGVKHQINETR